LLLLAVAAGLKVTAIHVDHGLRAASAGEARVVQAAALRLSAGFVALSVSVAPGPNLEARARAARYAVLPDGVMTGHTADDLAETMLVNLLRGAGLDGLSPMRPVAGSGSGSGSGSGYRILRPLVRLRRSETRALCASTGLCPVEDDSNDDPRFTRNRVRHDLLPLMADIASRDPVPILVRQSQLLGEEAALLDDLAGDLDPADAKAMAAAPPVLARRALRAWLRRSSVECHPPSAADVERVLEVARGDAVACELSGGRRVQRSKGRMTVLDTDQEMPTRRLP